MSKKDNQILSRPATTPENRELQLAALATDLAERQLRDGTASPSVITHFLKMGSPRELMERTNMARQNDLAEAKAEALRSERQVAAMISEAMDAFRSYAPTSQDFIPDNPVVMQPVGAYSQSTIW